MQLTPDISESAPILQKLNRDLKATAATMTSDEARYIVDLYYQLQDARVRAAGQVRAINQQTDEGATHELISFFLDQFESLERQMQGALGAFATSKMPGRWMQSICGIGPVISAGLLAHIDITRARYCGQLLRFAGLTNDEWLGKERAKALVKKMSEMAEDPENVEELIVLCAASQRRKPENLRAMMMVIGKEKDAEEGAAPKEVKLTKALLEKALAMRPWNADLKCLAVFKLGECFVKVQNNAKDYYGSVFAERKAKYAIMNEEGAFKAEVEKVLREKKIGKGTDAYKAYSQGKLPKAHLHARARRYAVKLFLSHLHEVMYFDHYNQLPALPWIIDIGGHRDFEPPPNMAMVPGLRGAYERDEKRRIYLTPDKGNDKESE